jgi:hypothetical protein
VLSKIAPGNFVLGFLPPAIGSGAILHLIRVKLKIFYPYPLMDAVATPSCSQPQIGEIIRGLEFQFKTRQQIPGLIMKFTQGMLQTLHHMTLRNLYQR